METAEQKLFAKISEEIKNKFESIGDAVVKESAEKAFKMYEESYKEQSEKGIEALNLKIEEINKSFEGLNPEQTVELGKQLTSIEEKLLGYENTLKEIGKKVTEGSMGSKGNSSSDFEKGIEEFLSSRLPNESGKVIFEAMEGMTLSSQAIGDTVDIKETNSKVAVLSAKSMFALPDMTTGNSVAGQAIARDMDTMGFRNIPPILNDHVADIFTTPKLGNKSFMTIRVFHTYVDGVDIKVEGTGTFAKSSIQLTSQDYKVFTYGTQYRISIEEYEDVPEIATELKNAVPDRMMNDLDEKIFTTGGDNSTAPWGAFSTNVTRANCTLFNAYQYAGSNTSADVADLVAKMKLYARSQNYRVNGVIAHDVFYDNYEGLRDDNGNSLQDRRVQFSPTGEITGMSGLATRKTRVMDELAVFVTATDSEIIGIRNNVMMQVGLNADDFATHNISTKFWGRFAYGAKDALANIYSPDFVADIAILKLSAADALTYTDEVAKATSGYESTNVTIALLKAAGGTSLVDANELAYQTAIVAETGIANLAALQVVIDAVNAA